MARPGLWSQNRELYSYGPANKESSDEGSREVLQVLTDKKKNAGIVDFHRKLLSLRRNQEGFSKGLQGSHLSVICHRLSTGVLAWRRWATGGPGDDVVVILNFSEESHRGYLIGVPEPGPWHLRLKTTEGGIAQATGDDDLRLLTVLADSIPYNSFPASISIAIAPLEGLVLSQDP